jgi:hypothetical protein
MLDGIGVDNTSDANKAERQRQNLVQMTSRARPDRVASRGNRCSLELTKWISFYPLQYDLSSSLPPESPDGGLYPELVPDLGDLNQGRPDKHSLQPVYPIEDKRHPLFNKTI